MEIKTERPFSEDNTIFPKARQVLGEKAQELAKLIEREKKSLQRGYE